ncbi:MAG: hemerythrin domain-containing protein [Polyangiaceae bacterium]|nr:hemerythrin domain-containing protein [Polyangiaceae bacterium]
MPPLPPPSERFRQQHAHLLQLALEIGQMFDAAGQVADADACRRKLATFAGALRVHAAMENEALYPRLLEHPASEVRDAAARLLDECGPLYDEFHDFLGCWPTAASIRADAPRFARDARRVFRKLGARMMKENDTLYPLADAHA